MSVCVWWVEVVWALELINVGDLGSHGSASTLGRKGD